MTAPIMAFTTPQAVRLTGLPPTTIYRWENQGVFKASYVDERPRKAYRRFFTFRDIVSLRTLQRLRHEHHIPLDQLRRVGSYLEQHTESPWATISFKVVGRSLEFIDPVSKVTVSSRPFGQRTLTLDLAEIAAETELEARALTNRNPEDVGVVTRHRHVMANAWILAGTRIPTSAIWNFYEGGASNKRILQAYPDLTLKDIESAIAHELALRAAA
jgi:uncharacterized protein (DUF433 family)